MLMLIEAGCHKSEPAQGVAVESEWIELNVAGPGMGPAEIEAQVVQPIEEAMLSTPGLRHVTAEAGEAHARVWLEFEAGQTDAALNDVQARLSSLEPKLPPSIEHPILRRGDTPGSTFVRWAIASDTIDASMMSKLHEELVVRVQQLGGVFDAQTCALQPRVVIELEPERLRAYGIESTDVEAALRVGVADTPSTLDIDGLRRTIIDVQGGTAVTLTEVAAIRYGMRESTCVAASATGLVAAASVNVRDRSAQNAVEHLLDQAAVGFPAGTRLLRFGAADTTIELSVARDRELAEVAESIGSGLVRLAQPWLLEVGIAAEPCVAVGTRVRVSVAGSEPVSLDSFRSIPGVTHVRLLDAASERQLWLLGPDPDVLQEIAAREEARLRALPSMLSVDVYTEAPRAELRIEADRAALAKHGITASEFARQLALIQGELEVAELRDADGVRVPVMLRVGASEDMGAGQVGDVLIHAGTSDVRLDAIADIREAPGPAKMCRYDGQRGLVFVLQAAESNAWTTLAPYVAAALPPGYRWSWVD